MSILIGVTGGIGSGKTTVCRLFHEKGIPVIYADEISHALTNTNPTIRKNILEYFGKESYKENTFNRSYIAKRVFQNPKELAKLNSIIHPHVIREIEKQSRQYSSHHYILIEAALFFETPLHEKMDYILAIVADEEKRIQRVCERDTKKKEEVQQRMQNQLSTEEIVEKADFVLHNNGTLSELKTTIQFFDTIFSKL